LKTQNRGREEDEKKKKAGVFVRAADKGLAVYGTWNVYGEWRRGSPDTEKRRVGRPPSLFFIIVDFQTGFKFFRKKLVEGRGGGGGGGEGEGEGRKRTSERRNFRRSKR